MKQTHSYRQMELTPRIADGEIHSPEHMRQQVEQARQQAQEQNRRDYDWLWEHLPEICPKSLSAYSRMKNQNSEKYQILVAEANALGYIIK